MIDCSKNSKVLISLVSEFITLRGDFYDIRNFSIAFPNTRNSLCKKIHHFVIHGYSTDKSKERRVAEFNDWFTRSLSLKLNSEDATICNHYFLEDADIMNHDNDPEGPATISTEEAYFCSDEYQEFLDNDDITTRTKFYNMIDQFCLKTSPEEELKSFKKLFDNSELRKWFYEIEQISSFYDHITIIFNLATQTIHCDIGLVIKYLFMEARMKPETPISNFSIISLKSEMSQEWVLHGSREGGLTLFDLFIDSRFSIQDTEFIIEMFPDCCYDIKRQTKCEPLDLSNNIPFRTQQDKIWDFCILKNIRKFQLLQKQYADLEFGIKSITNISQFKSYDIVLSRNLTNIKLLDIENQTKILNRLNGSQKYEEIYLKTSKRDIRVLLSNMDNFHTDFNAGFFTTIDSFMLIEGTLLTKFVTKKRISLFDFSINSRVVNSKIKSKKILKGTKDYENIVNDSLMYPRILRIRKARAESISTLPWIYDYPLTLRFRLFKGIDNRQISKKVYSRSAELFIQRLHYLRYVYSKQSV